MIFQPDEYHSGSDDSRHGPLRGFGETPGSYGRLSGHSDRLGESSLPAINRLSLSDGAGKEPSLSTFPDALNHPRTLRLVIAGVQHRGESVLTDLTHEFPSLVFAPNQRQIAFRAALLEAVTPSADGGNTPHSLIRQERVHRALGVALSNLVARATGKPIRELSCDDSEDAEVPPELEMSEYLASSWVVRSFIRVATTEPEMFRILVTEMASINSTLGRFSLGVPMSPVLVYEFFNAAARNPELTPDVIRAFQIIGYRGEIGERLFKEFSSALDKQVTDAS